MLRNWGRERVRKFQTSLVNSVEFQKKGLFNFGGKPPMESQIQIHITIFFDRKIPW